jgi:hypothetical protein
MRLDERKRDHSRSAGKKNHMENLKCMPDNTQREVD